MILNISICLFEQTNASVKTEDLKTVNALNENERVKPDNTGRKKLLT